MQIFFVRRRLKIRCVPKCSYYISIRYYIVPFVTPFHLSSSQNAQNADTPLKSTPRHRAEIDATPEKSRKIDFSIGASDKTRGVEGFLSGARGV